MFCPPSSNDLDPQSLITERLQINYLLNPQQSLADDDGKDVILGLTQQPKSLSPRYFYDRRGSELFEQICELPEYYPTRTEAGILEQYATQIAELTGACELIELGSGSSKKTRLLLDAYQQQEYPLRYLPIDVSGTMLETSAHKLLKDYPQLSIHGKVSTYELALQNLSASTLPGRMLLFLGSTIGNFTPSECDRFLQQIAAALQPGEYFLLGVDLQKSPEIIEAAYNDSQGVTAAFNLNVLSHLNNRFQGNFAVNLFEHQAFYNDSESQIEMHLQCQRSHHVSLAALDLNVEFEEGETILTEISRKFNLEKMQANLEQIGFKTVQVWTDPQQWFGVILYQFSLENQ